MPLYSTISLRLKGLGSGKAESTRLLSLVDEAPWERCIWGICGYMPEAVMRLKNRPNRSKIRSKPLLTKGLGVYSAIILPSAYTQIGAFQVY